MFAGHLGAAMMISRGDRRLNVGALVLAAVLLDVVLWLLILLGWESVIIPADFSATHQPAFVFPYSHGLLASIGWSAATGVAASLWYPGLPGARLRAGALLAAAVFSHWLLDALVHAPELPLAGAGSAKVGLGLWNFMPAALAVEGAIAVAGLWLFLEGAQLPRARKLWLSLLSLSILAFTVTGMTVAPAPPSATAMAASSLVTLVAVCALVAWLARQPR